MVPGARCWAPHKLLVQVLQGHGAGQAPAQPGGPGQVEGAGRVALELSFSCLLEGAASVCSVLCSLPQPTLWNENWQNGADITTVTRIQGCVNVERRLLVSSQNPTIFFPLKKMSQIICGMSDKSSFCAAY